jgi:(1->4)-alpha-D-glucan 1-alpha-D-glucosylmutase
MRVPVATYRLQFNPSFGFRAAEDLVPYLADLGISDVYASPIFRARRGSAHGYDVADHNQINPELGSWDDFLGLIGILKERGMELLQDMVPNHMAYSIENPMIADILERGEWSRYFSFFDVDWNYRSPGLAGRILAPFLGEHYGDALEKGEISLAFNQSGFSIAYHGLLFPLRLESYVRVLGLEEKLEKWLIKELGKGPEDQELMAMLGAIGDLALRASESPDDALELKTGIWRLYSRNRAFKAFLDSRLNTFRGKKGRPESFDLLDSLLLEQLFSLSFWKAASQEVNYRRFFTINDLISLRVERREVFEHVHTMLFDMVARGEVTGIRVDHIDGLYDPEGYLERLRENVGDLYVIVEKILGWNENLPNWPVQGTTGYDFLNYLNGVFCNKENAFAFDEIYRSFTGLSEPYEDILYKKKRLILERYMGGDVDNLAHRLKVLAEKDRHGRDLTLSELRAALEEFMIGLSVYRTYIVSESPSDKSHSGVQTALEKALRRRPDLFKEIDFLGRTLTEPLIEPPIQEECKFGHRPECMNFVMRLSQFTGPLMAKGFEDTVLYYYNRLISLNEVGGSPERFGTSQEEFYAFNAVRSERWLCSLNATSTHDTKRGEDARARINVLSEIPGEWANALGRWRRMNEPRKRNLNGRIVPDRNEEYSLYQSLIGALPFFHEDPEVYSSFLTRTRGYLVKALREAKTHSDWMDPNPAYEDAFIAFFQDIMEPSTDFFEDFISFQRNVALCGLQNSLSQTLLKIASPGVPDFYQGAELWDFSFVDPDNRRGVDFDIRRSYLEEIKRQEDINLLGLIKELMAGREDGRIKLFLIHRALLARKANADLFRLGRYLPLKADGAHKDKIIAFARVHNGSWALALAPRFPASQSKSWGDTSLIIPKAAPMRWRDAVAGKDFVGRRLSLEEAFEHFPAALLLGQEG